MDRILPDASFILFAFYRPKDVLYLPENKLPYLDLTYCVDGYMEYDFNGKHYILNSGDAILYPPGSVRCRKYTNASTLYASFNIGFEEAFTSPISGYFHNCITPETIHTLETIKKVNNSVSSNKNEKIFALFTFLFHQLIEARYDNDSPYVKIIKQYIADNLTKQLSIAELAKVVHLSPNYLCDIFKKETNTTITQHIIANRIDLAKRLIVTEKDPLFEIISKCGFTDYNCFSNTFKKVVGVSPARYRKMNTE